MSVICICPHRTTCGALCPRCGENLTADHDDPDGRVRCPACVWTGPCPGPRRTSV